MARKTINTRMPIELLKILDNWRSRQIVPPTRTEVIVKALTEFVEKYALTR